MAMCCCERRGGDGRDLAPADIPEGKALKPWAYALKHLEGLSPSSSSSRALPRDSSVGSAESTETARTSSSSGNHEQVKLPVQIMPHLLLGDKMCARDVVRLRELGVTHVLNAAGQDGVNSEIDFDALGIKHANVDGKDVPGYPMLERHLGFSRSFIKAAFDSGGRCLVHCLHGKNRSAVLVAAEVMLHEQISVLEAVSLCRRERGSSFLTNESFQLELVELASRHYLLGPRPMVPRSSRTSRPCGEPSVPRASVVRHREHQELALAPRPMLRADPHRRRLR